MSPGSGARERAIDRTRGGAWTGPPAPAATVVLLRPGPDGVEVLLTRRPATMAFAADVHVFPGGRVDAADGSPDAAATGGLSAEEAARRLAGTLDPAAALAHFVAAVRETREETGIKVVASDLIPLTRWVTPLGLPRRFEVRFFAVPVPAGTEPSGDSPEVASYAWFRPEVALAAHATGELELLLPTVVTLQQLDGLANAKDVELAFTPGEALGPPGVGPVDSAGVLRRVDQRWVAGIAGRSRPGWLVGRRSVILVDPGDPTGETTDAVLAAVARDGLDLTGILLTGLEPEQHAGVELYAAGRGLPVIAGPGTAARCPYPLDEIGPGNAVPFGDVPLVIAGADPATGALDVRIGSFDGPSLGGATH
ncbi:MAG: NUDIX domain-containing protein [Candidatus Limnocylindrales bacterium]